MGETADLITRAQYSEDGYRALALRDLLPMVPTLPAVDRPRVVELARGAVTDTDPRTRGIALLLLGKLGVDPDFIANSLTDPEPWPRLSAVSALTDFDPPAHPEKVSSLHDDPDPDVRQQVEWFFETLTAPRRQRAVHTLRDWVCREIESLRAGEPPPAQLAGVPIRRRRQPRDVILGMIPGVPVLAALLIHEGVPPIRALPSAILIALVIVAAVVFGRHVPMGDPLAPPWTPTDTLAMSLIAVFAAVSLALALAILGN